MDIIKAELLHGGDRYFVSYTDSKGVLQMKYVHLDDLVDYVEANQMNQTLLDEYNPFAEGGHAQSWVSVDPVFFIQDQLPRVLTRFLNENP